MSTAARVVPTFPDSIFRAYDIRGVVPKTLTAETAYWIGRAIGSQSLAQGEPNVSVGRDGRLSGPELVERLIQGLADSGCHVSDVGLVPTPALYYAANVLAGKSGVMLTGSHNPSDYNGFKIVIAGDTLANEQIQALHERLKTNDLTTGTGSITKVDILQRYSDQITGDVKLARRLKVVVDCGNGAAGVIAPQLLEALNCEVIPFQPDGLPDSRLRGVPDAAALQLLFTPRQLGGVAWVVHDNAQFVGLVRVKRIRHVEGERQVTPDVRAEEGVVQPDIGALVDRAEVQQHPFVGIRGDYARERELAAIVQHVGGLNLSLDPGEQRFW